MIRHYDYQTMSAAGQGLQNYGEPLLAYCGDIPYASTIVHDALAPLLPK